MMNKHLLAALFFCAFAWVAAVQFVQLVFDPPIYCTEDSPHGPTIGGVIRIEGCP
jgi:hypothetical protein